MARSDGGDLEGWLGAECRLARRAVVSSVALGTLAALLAIAQAWLLSRALDAAVMHRAALSRILPPLWPLALIMPARFAVAALTEVAGLRGAVAVKQDLRGRVFRHLQALGPAWLSTRHSGEIATAVIDGVEALDAYCARYLPQRALALVVPAAILAFVAAGDWVSGLVLAATAPLIIVFMILVGTGAERRNQRQWRDLARMAAHFLDALQGLTTLKLFNASRREAAVVAKIADDYRMSTMAVLRVAFLSSVVLEFFSALGIAVVAVLLGFRLLHGSVELSTGLFVLLLAPGYYLPLRMLGTHYHARMDAIAAAERIVSLLAAPAPVRAGAARPCFERPIAIEFDDVHYAYAPGRVALDGASFGIEAGRVTALVGRSGAGKSTVLNALLDFINPQRGRIIVGGHQLDAIDRAHWLAQVAWLPQRPQLFEGSILDNIQLGNPGASREAVLAAARAAHADAFIARLPRGYDTLVGERGQTLSGGEAQRIALARAFLKDAPLVLMDEPTASLDPETEALIVAALARLASGRTLLVVAHRLRTVRAAERIVVLDRGRVAESGTHDALLRLGGAYAALVGALPRPAHDTAGSTPPPAPMRGLT
jgi:ATP-binding cassette subfamily C protein CydD